MSSPPSTPQTTSDDNIDRAIEFVVNFVINDIVVMNNSSNEDVDAEKIKNNILSEVTDFVRFEIDGLEVCESIYNTEYNRFDAARKILPKLPWFVYLTGENSDRAVDQLMDIVPEMNDIIDGEDTDDYPETYDPNNYTSDEDGNHNTRVW